MFATPKYKKYYLYDRKGYLILVTTDKRIYEYYRKRVVMMGAKKDRLMPESSKK